MSEILIKIIKVFSSKTNIILLKKQVMLKVYYRSINNNNILFLNIYFKQFVNSSFLIIDGTFSVASKLFYQLYIIYSQVKTYKNQIVPLVYVLLIKKTIAIYIKMFKQLVKYTKSKNLFLQL